MSSRRSPGSLLERYASPGALLYAPQFPFAPGVPGAWAPDVPTSLPEGLEQLAGRTTPFVAGPPGSGAPYESIQDAIDASAAAGYGFVSLLPGQYQEDIELHDGTILVGPDPRRLCSAIIAGQIALRSNVNAGAAVKNVSITNSAQDCVIVESIDLASVRLDCTQCNIEQMGSHRIVLVSDNGGPGYPAAFFFDCALLRFAYGTGPAIEQFGIGTVYCWECNCYGYNSTVPQRMTARGEWDLQFYSCEITGPLHADGAYLLLQDCTQYGMVGGASGVLVEAGSRVYVKRAVILDRTGGAGNYLVAGAGDLALSGLLVPYVREAITIDPGITVLQADSIAPYRISVALDWPVVNPKTTKEALDELARRVKALGG